MWLDASHGKAVATFTEQPGKPGMKLLLNMVANKTSAWLAVAPNGERTSLRLAEESMGSGAALTASLPASLNGSAAMLEGSTRWGLFPELNKTSPPMLQYWFGAPLVHTPHDWFFVDQEAQNRLSITLRPALCTKGSTTAKVIAITRLDGQNLGNHEVQLFDASGAKTSNVTTSSYGIATLELNVGEVSYAMFKHLEHAPGVDPATGKAYSTVAHYATTSAHIECNKS